jgi:hypothetical protein
VAVEILVEPAGPDGADGAGFEPERDAREGSAEEPLELVKEAPEPRRALREAEVPSASGAPRTRTADARVAAKPGTSAARAAAALPAQPERARDPDPAGWVSPAAVPPRLAIVIDDGELDDVFATLEGAGANPILHRRRDASSFRGWAAAPRVLVASARSALSLRLPPGAAAAGVVTLAVAEARSQLLTTLLRRQGFRYVVRRPVHPEALRLLLLRSLYRGLDHRRASRLPFGCEISWRAGWRTRSGTLLELSASGCRLLSAVAVKPSSRVSVRVPAELAGGRELRLTGRVARCDRQGPGACVLAIELDTRGRRIRERLRELLGAREAVPVTLARKPGVEPPPAATKVTPPPASAETPVAEDERRLGRRAVPDREIGVLEGPDDRVEHVLVGRDLSVGGLRVDAHPALAVGRRLRLAIYDAASLAPLVVDAWVVRDDGAAGVVMRFAGVTGDTLRRLRQLVAQLPSLEELSAGSSPHGVVVAEILHAHAPG